MSNTTQQKRYFLFSKKTMAKTGEPKPLRRATTRAEARAHKDGNPSYGIWDAVNAVEVR